MCSDLSSEVASNRLTATGALHGPTLQLYLYRWIQAHARR